MSIKSKLITAVTTAGLLASLFGTALLPVARAADGVVGDIVVDSSDADVLTDDTTTFYVKAGKTITVGIAMEDVGDDAGDQVNDTLTLTVTGTTISAWVPQAGGTIGAAIAASGKTGTAVLFNYEDTVSLQVNIVGPAAGTTASVKVSDAAADDTDTIYLIGVGTGSYGVPDSANTVMDKQCAPDNSSGSAGGGAGCWDTKVDYIAASSAIGYDLGVEDGLGLAVASYPITATITGGVAGVEFETFDATCAGTDDSSSSDVILDDDVQVCVLSDGTVSLPFTLTVTVGSLTFTRKIAVVGEIATLALTGPAAVASIGHDNMVDAAQWAEEYADQYAVVAKDAAGNIIGNGGGDAATLKANGIDFTSSGSGVGTSEEDQNQGNAEGVTGGDFAFSVKDGNGVSLSFGTDNNYVLMKSNMAGNTDEYEDDFLDIKVLAGTRHGADALGDEDALDPNYVVSNPGDLIYNVPSNLCEPGDEGDTRKISVVDDTGTISSNVVTTTCVNDGVKLSGATASATSAAKNGSVTFTFSATDGEGRAVGIGASAGITVTPSWEAASAATLSFAGGTTTLKYKMDVDSGSHYLIFTRTDNDPITAGNQTWAEKYTVSVTNAADSFTAPSFYKSTAVKARAVVIFPAAAGKTIAFTVENARTGVVRTYYRKANAQGKAWYTIAARGTYYVTALYLGESTDTLRLVK